MQPWFVCLKVVEELSGIIRQQSLEEAPAESAPAAPETAESAAPLPSDGEDDLWECLDKKVAEVSFLTKYQSFIA